eukprot:680583-Rhodomonas_salina.2
MGQFTVAISPSGSGLQPTLGRNFVPQASPVEPRRVLETRLQNLSGTNRCGKGPKLLLVAPEQPPFPVQRYARGAYKHTQPLIIRPAVALVPPYPPS